MLSFPVVGVGASAGGLEAVKELLHHLPADTGMAFVLVQHLDPTHESMLTEILSRATRMPVSEVKNLMPVESNHVYVIPPGMNMIISHGVLELSPRSDSRPQPRSIDHFLGSLAEDQGHQAIGVILSGSASDGTLGLEQIKAEGGITFAQDATAQHDSMPRSAIATGCVDFVLPPNEIGAELARIARHPYIGAAAKIAADPDLDPNYAGIIGLLRDATLVDFTHYKATTLHRRITRRMVLRRVEGLRNYLHVLKHDESEVDALFQDILINVTSFFRNPNAFEFLKTKVFPRLVTNRARHQPLRVWVLGCSTGEEAYSIAIVLAEFLEASGRSATVPAQVFATDLNAASIEKARLGVYSKNIANDVSPERLRRFFNDVDAGFRISKPIRDMCVFARHDVLGAPPFSHMDLISCRNLLIYLEPELQQRVIPTLHYALEPHGFLWLGSSETIGSARDLFELDEAKYKIYAKKAGTRGAVGPHLVKSYARGEPGPAQKPGRIREPVIGFEAQKEADQILLARYVPPAVLVNSELEILQFRGDTGPYLTPAPGKASLGLLKMLREGLLVPVRGAIHKAKKEQRTVREEDLHVRSHDGHRRVDVEVIPIRGAPSDDNFLVLFAEAPVLRSAVRSLDQSSPSAPGGQEDQETADHEIARLTQELAAIREYLQAVNEGQEAANEELQASNEEVQSANEELQSINEELETSREEIQSSNEELATVNDELQHRNLELTQSNNDLNNLLTGVQMAIVMLGPDLRIRRFTPAAEKLLNLIATDVGRPISDLRLDLSVDDLGQMLLGAIDSMTSKEQEVQDKYGRWYSLRVRPYKTLENRIEGALLVLVDIDALKQHEEELHRRTALLDQAYEAIFIWDFDGPTVYWNSGAEEMYGYARDQAIGRRPEDLLATSPRDMTFRSVLEAEGRWTGELVHTRRDGRQIVVDSRMVMVPEADGRRMVIETARPTTERKQLELSLRQRADELATADQRKNEFLAILAHELRNPLMPLLNAIEIVKAPTATTEQQRRAVHMLEQQIGNLSRMIDDLLDVSRITQGKVQLRQETIELAGVVTRSLEVSRSLLASGAHDVKVSLPDSPFYLEADPVRLEQILTNLIVNACKFTPEGGRIVVSTEAAEPLSDGGTKEVIIRVRDEGVGIAREALPHVFDLFMQADRSLDRTQGGLGIGLTMVKRLVELHGGTVEALSAGIGQGSEFVIRLPVRTNHSRIASRPAASIGRSPEPRRILVVDDNADAVESMEMLMRLAGHDVRTAHNGSAALAAAAAFRPHVVLLDIGLPGMDGYEVARRLRQQTGLGDMLIVALSGYGHDHDRRRAHAAGFDHHLTKPPDFAALTDLISRWRPAE